MAALDAGQPIVCLGTQAGKPPTAVSDQSRATAGLRQRVPLLDSHHVDGPDVVFPGPHIGRHPGERHWYLVVEVLLA
jgi:hypothetical protein